MSKYKVGDFVMLGDEGVGRYVENLSDLIYSPKEISVLLSRPPVYSIKSPCGNSSREVFAERKVYNERWGFVEQVLTVFLGSPMWINV